MAIWASIAPQLLALGYKVVCADLRGYGASDKSAAQDDLQNYSFRAMARDQLGLMRALGHRPFHLVGHDRGARTAYRLALDHPDAVETVTLMDIAPTEAMLNALRSDVAKSYWHWFFLAQPAPFPERMIENDPDFFFEACLLGWGGARLDDFNPDQLAAYRASWRETSTIAGYCNDYRATLTVDILHDRAEQGRRVVAPALMLYGASGAMAKLYNLAELWRSRCVEVDCRPIPGGHFFPDTAPDLVVKELATFLARHRGSD